MAKNPWRHLFWYSDMELAPGIRTRTDDQPPYWTMSLTRQALRQTSLAGKKCLDIGSVDGFMPTVMSLSGASRVVSVDCCDYSQQIEIVKQAYGVQFEYIPRVGSLKLVERMLDLHKFGDRKFVERGRDIDDYDFGYDVVNCSGVIYHIFSPLHLIGALRTLVRPGGLVFLETPLIDQNDYYLSFNYFGAGQYIYAYSDTWFITPPLLDYFLRMFNLLPIDLIYRTNKPIDTSRKIGRATVVCRAVSQPLAQSEEYQLSRSVMNFEYDELYRLELERLKSPTDVPYGRLVGPECRNQREGWEHLDLYAAAKAQERFTIAYEFAKLNLSDRS